MLAGATGELHIGYLSAKLSQELQSYFRVNEMTNATPLRLSVGIPVYNMAATIDETIESLLGQTIAPFEIVISENYSTDGTDRILERYSKYVRIIRPPHHLPAVENWNYLVNALKGEWFTIFAADDVAQPNFVSTLLSGINRDEAAVLVRAGWQIIDGKGNLGARRYILSVGRRQIWPNTLYESLLGPKICCAAFAASRAAWIKVGGFPKVIKFPFDWAFWVLLAAEGSFIYEPSIISWYRADYRPGLEEARAVRSIQDAVTIHNKIIPAVILRGGKVDMRIIERGRREFLCGPLANQYARLPLDKRSDGLAALREFAQSPREQREVDQIQCGRISVNYPLRDILRRFVRSLLTIGHDFRNLWSR
jgi:glycosyltransferase involved in cell wall biosynthesis